MHAHSSFDEHVQGAVAWLAITARAMVDKPQDVQVEGFVYDDHVRLNLRVHSDDIGQVVGQGGRNAKALRCLLMVFSSNRGIRYRLNILV